MTLTAERTTAGFEPVANIYTGAVPPPNKWELTPNTAFARGDMVVLTNGKIAAAAAGATNVVGVMAEAFTTSTNPSAGTAPVYGRVYDNPGNIYLCTFSDHTDSTATSGTTTTLVDTALSTSSDNDWRGALVYIYEGTNAGTLLTVKTYTGATDTLTFEEVMPAAFDTTSKYIMLGVGGSADVINFGKIGVDLKDANTIDGNATVGSEAGPLVVMPMGPEAVTDIKNLMLRVMVRKHLYNTP